MLIVTGATGQLGKRIVANLLRHVPAQRIGVSVRATDKASDLAAQGVRVRAGDYDRPESLRHAWEGAEQLLLISSNAAASGGDPIAQHANAIAVARELGVARIFYTSQVSASPASLFPPGRDHGDGGAAGQVRDCMDRAAPRLLRAQSARHAGRGTCERHDHGTCRRAGGVDHA